MMKIVLIALLLFTKFGYAQGADTSFVLDSSKPYVYLVFDHVGPRKPVQQGENPQGLWLRIINNCKAPIAVKTYEGVPDNLGVVVFDEVIAIGEGITVHADYGVIPTEQMSVQTLIGDQPVSRTPVGDGNARQSSAIEEQTKPKMPQGYSADLSFVAKVLPGKSLLFSVPRAHVSPGWFMRVKFTLDVSKPAVGAGPLTELDFFNEQIPVTRGSLGNAVPVPNEGSNHETGHPLNASEK